MTDAAVPAPVPRFGWRRWRNRKLGSPAFQSWASRNPLTRGRVRRDGERLFGLVSGFVQSQVLFAVVELDLLAATRDAPRPASELAAAVGMTPDRMELLCHAVTALGLFERVRGGYQLAPLGAALLGVPGLTEMILHHEVFYRDMSDPVALLRGARETELAGFWPYVFGAGSADDPAVADRYSRLMSESQALVAEDTLRMVRFDGVGHLLDIGGGTGAFLAAVGAAYPDLKTTLFDLPAVVPAAQARFERAGMAARATLVPGSFRDDPLPRGADAVSLVRVLYDHADDTVRALLAKVFAALPPGGRLIVSEPMTGGDAPCLAGDVYFAFYCMAMQTGRARSAAQISALLAEAGFAEIEVPHAPRPFIASVVTARKPAKPDTESV
ncbi:demethylspheroidene O-methyltransferase [Rhodovulum imhoffii]|uniref:Demethylspheroidene O-methyltransferase n=1 Tax=Rhodovulum imhoffii TaxID=365340 RepID=A0A2T5BSJ6_9RHOB|nr:methyltransferase [Rhodovulum imhoffii]MBK5933446.1 SAM-dependent methyltransferase [Rhodovulum imhoffii]PTN02317.1 demethylspheroidene O-methyltransferase [Rhodovulum imhoffii]